MADSKISALDELVTSQIASGDWIPIVDVSDTSMAASGTNKKIDAGNVIVTDKANTFAPSGSTTVPITINSPAAATAYNLEIKSDGTSAFRTAFWATVSAMALAERNLGNDTPGPTFAIGNNTSAGAVGPAAGTLRLVQADGTNRYFWVDASGNLRIHTAPPRGSTGSPTVADTAGTVVGTQSSSRDSKDVQDGLTDLVDVIAAIRAGAEAVKRFTYKNGAYNGETFEGVVVDDAPRYGMDRDEQHPAGKSLNVVTVLGDLLRVVADLTERVATLEAKLA